MKKLTDPFLPIFYALELYLAMEELELEEIDNQNIIQMEADCNRGCPCVDNTCFCHIVIRGVIQISDLPSNHYKRDSSDSQLLSSRNRIS